MQWSARGRIWRKSAEISTEMTCVRMAVGEEASGGCQEGWQATATGDGDDDGDVEGLAGNDRARVERWRLGRLVDILHQPFEDVHVAVHRDVNLVEAPLVGQVRRKSSPRAEEQLARAVEVAVDPAVVVAHVDDDHVVAASCDRWRARRPRCRTFVAD